MILLFKKRNPVGELQRKQAALGSVGTYLLL